MRNFTPRVLFVLFASLLLSSSLNAQDLWTQESPAGQSSYAQRNIRTLPDEVAYYKLNTTLLRSRMQAARSFTGTDGGQTAELTFPMPDGEMLNAAVYESSILSPEVQAKIPTVKTYLLMDKVTRNSLGRITITPDGISGIIFNKKGTVYISPTDKNPDPTHITYYSKDIKVPEAIRCDVTGESGSSGREFNLSRVAAGDCQLRTYRLAIAATGEYYVWAGSSKAQALAYITICINQITAIYERDATIRFTLVTNNNIIYDDATTDPYDGVTLGNAVITANDNFTDANLGVPYDIGVVFNNGWSGGLAQLNSVCTANKGRSGAGINFGFGANPTTGPQGPAFDGTVAHEIGHQFGATHTMTSNTGGCLNNTTPASAWEPGGGSTIMAYAGTCSGTAYQANSDLYFHTGNVAQMATFATLGAGNTCPAITPLTNTAPVVTVAAASYTIPASTPFALTANATDAQSNLLTYTWEQMDANAIVSTSPSATATTGPNFRSFPPSTNNTRYLPSIRAVVNNFSLAYEVLPSVARTMNFRVNVRDNAAGGGCNAQADIAVNTSTASAPFLVTSQNAPVTLTADGATTFTVTWDVASTTAAPFNTANVEILFSADGGETFTTLVASTPNDGTHSVLVPNMLTSSGRVMVKSIGNIFYNINTANITITSVCNAEGALLSPASDVSAGAGTAGMNLAIAPAYGTNVFPINQSLTTADPISTLAVFSSVTGACQNFNGNLSRYKAYTFRVSVAGNYTISRSAGSAVMNLYVGAFDPQSPCTNFRQSNVTYNGMGTSNAVSMVAALLPGVEYTLTVGTFSGTSPALPYSFTITNSSVPAGGAILNGYTNPGASYSYRYVIINSSNVILAIATTPDLSNGTNYPAGTYRVYGFSYLTANFNPAALSAYVGQNISSLRNDLATLPTTRCGMLSRNAVTATALVVLPVDLLPLTAMRKDQRVKLYWATATEINSVNFEVERSGDGRNFSLIKSVTAAGNSTSRINYTTYDENPLPGTNYYRIKAVSLDDRTRLSNIAMVRGTAKGFEVKLYPNPVTDVSTLEVIASKKSIATLVIANAAGIMVYQESVNLEKGMNIQSIDMTKYPAGVYHLKIATANEVVVVKAIRL